MGYKYIDKLENVTAKVLKNTLYEKYKYTFDHMEKIYIFGTGLLGEFAYHVFEKNGVNVCGFIDNDLRKQGQFLNETKIYSLEEIGRGATVVIASLMFWYEMKEQLELLNFKHYFCYEELALVCSRYPNYNQSFYGYFEKMEKQKGCYDEIYDRLDDVKSKQVLDWIIAFRLTLDTEFTKKAFNLSIVDGEQYFDRDILEINRNEVFLDGGGYDGDSIKNFIKWNRGNYEKILFFEPDRKMVDKAKENLKAVSGIEYYQRALGSKEGTANYDSTGNQTGGGHIIDSGDTKVEICTIDSLNQDITLLKLDTEGYEMEILGGGGGYNKEM